MSTRWSNQLASSICCCTILACYIVETVFDENTKLIAKIASTVIDHVSMLSTYGDGTSVLCSEIPRMPTQARNWQTQTAMLCWMSIPGGKQRHRKQSCNLSCFSARAVKTVRFRNRQVTCTHTDYSSLMTAMFWMSYSSAWKFVSTAKSISNVTQSKLVILMRVLKSLFLCTASSCIDGKNDLKLWSYDNVLLSTIHILRWLHICNNESPIHHDRYCNGDLLLRNII